MQHKHILIVDDETIIAEELAEFLESFNYICATAFNAEQAEACVEADPNITLVMTDMRMPGRDGAELIKALKDRSGRDFEYIMISGHLDADQDLEHIQATDVTLMRKPINIDSLTSFLEGLTFAEGFKA